MLGKIILIALIGAMVILLALSTVDYVMNPQLPTAAQQPAAAVSQPPVQQGQAAPAQVAPAQPVAPAAKPARPTLAEIRAKQEAAAAPEAGVVAKNTAAKPATRPGGSTVVESDGSIFLLSGMLGLLGGLADFVLTLLVIVIVLAITLTLIVVVVSKKITAADAVQWYGRGAKRAFIFCRYKVVGSKMDPEDEEPRRW